MHNISSGNYQDHAYENDDGYSLIVASDEQTRSIAFRLRLEAYASSGLNFPEGVTEFSDLYDELENHISHILLKDDMAIATIRACRKSSPAEHIAAMDAYEKEINETFGKTTPIVESNRFAMSPRVTGLGQMPLFHLFRAITLNAAAIDAKNAITAVRPRHVPVYKRYFRMQPISKPRLYPGLSWETVLLNCDVDAAVMHGSKRIPHLFVSADMRQKYMEDIQK